jgi:hypothetical protein
MTEATKPGKRPQDGSGRPSADAAAPQWQPTRATVRGMSKTIIEALDDPDLFGGMFVEPSWKSWRTFVTALQGLPMSAEHLAIYRHHTGRTEPPTKASRYAELIVGRRGGKSRILALIACYLSCVIDHRDYIVAGEVPVVAIIAKDRDQARVILNYVGGFLRSIPLFAAMVEDELAESIRLSNGVVIEVHTASISAPRGRTFLAVLCDEIAFWPSGDSANPDIEVINSVRLGLSTIPRSLLLVASSPYAKLGVLYANYAKYFGKDDTPMLVWQGTTEEMNSSLVGDPLIAEMYAEDHDRALAELGAQFRSDIVSFITREAVEDVIAHGVRELPPGDGIVYAAFVDPSGGSADSMTLGIGHCETSGLATSGLAVLDCVREVRPPFSPDMVVEEFSVLLKIYGISRVTGDAYAGMWPRERFAAHGISYDVSALTKSAIYREFLPALNGQRVRLLDLPRLIGQLVSLERRTSRGGKDSIDAPPGSHEDVANAVCGVLANTLADRRPALVRQADMLKDGEAAPLPQKALWVVAVLSVDEKGNFGVVYGAKGIPSQKPGLWLLDFDSGPMRGSIFADISARIRELCIACRAPNGTVFVPEELQGHARQAELRCELIPLEFYAEGRLLSVGAHATAGNIQLCAPALEKARNSPFAGALNFRAGEAADDPLRRSAILCVALSLDRYERKPAA